MNLAQARGAVDSVEHMAGGVDHLERQGIKVRISRRPGFQPFVSDDDRDPVNAGATT